MTEVHKEYGGVIIMPGCSLGCLFCSPDSRPSPQELRRQEINVYKNLLEFKQRGVGHLEISGSDPIEYDKILPLIRYIKAMGFETIQLSTHGVKLAEPEFFDEFIASGATKVRLPLYGSKAAVHDAITRTNGSFKKIITGIKSLLKKAPHIAIQVSTLIMPQNKNDLVGIIQLMRSLEINDFYFSIPCVADNDYSYYLPLKDAGPFVKKAWRHCAKVNFPAVFMEIPYCIFGLASSRINNQTSPPDLGQYCQPPQQHRSPIKDLPAYRLKKKAAICRRCRYRSSCDGFFVNDINKFGTGSLKPL